jgi:hypothetical protein
MIFSSPAAGYISDKILRSSKKVLIIGTVVYAITLGNNMDDRRADHQH